MQVFELSYKEVSTIVTALNTASKKLDALEKERDMNERDRLTEICEQYLDLADRFTNN